MNTCPHCGRRLLTHTSAKCNWCGQEIKDDGYQQQAQAERGEFFAHQAARDAQSLANARGIGVSGVSPFLDPFGDPVLDLLLLAPTRQNAPDYTLEAARQAARAEREQAKAAERAKAQKEAEEAAANADAPQERFRHLEL